MRLNCGTVYPVLPIPFLLFGSSRSGNVLDRVCLTFYDQVVQNLLLPVVEVRSVELPKAHP